MEVRDDEFVANFDGDVHPWDRIMDRKKHESADDWEFWEVHGKEPAIRQSGVTPVKGSVKDPAEWEKLMKSKRDDIFRSMCG